MPSWRIHIEVAKRIGKHLNYNQEELQTFIYGTIDERFSFDNENILDDINRVAFIFFLSLQK